MNSWVLLGQIVDKYGLYPSTIQGSTKKKMVQKKAYVEADLYQTEREGGKKQTKLRNPATIQ